MKTTTDVIEAPPTTRASTRRAHGGMRTLKAPRTKAKEAQSQLRALLALTDTALSYLALDDLLRELLGRVTAVTGVDQVAIFLVDEDGQMLTLRATRRLLEEAVGQAQATVGQGFIGRIAATRDLRAGAGVNVRRVARGVARPPALRNFAAPSRCSRRPLHRRFSRWGEQASPDEADAPESVHTDWRSHAGHYSGGAPFAGSPSSRPHVPLLEASL
ncbi:MAG TPA: hypothetical protein VGS80_09070 [Ktedonobacterales bacterium]|nr:hypothetical protein [Ktedonobacterales bacterium]